MFVRVSQPFVRFYPQFDGEVIPFQAVKGCGTCVKSRALCPAYHQPTRGEFMGGVDQSEMENKTVTRPEASGLACPIFCGNQAFEPNLKAMLTMILQKSGFMWYVPCLPVWHVLTDDCSVCSGDVPNLEWWIWATVKIPAILNMYSTDIGLWKLMEIVKNTR